MLAGNPEMEILRQIRVGGTPQKKREKKGTESQGAEFHDMRIYLCSVHTYELYACVCKFNSF